MTVLAKPFKTLRSTTLIVAWREILDALRDRRTILMTIVLPVVLYPVLMTLPMYFVSPKRNPPRIAAVYWDSEAEAVVEMLNSTGLALVYEASPMENLTALVASAKVDLALEFERDFGRKIRAGRQAMLKVIWDPTSMRGSSGLSIVRTTVDSYSKQVAAVRLREQGIPEDVLNPVAVVLESVKAVPPQVAMLAMMIPMMVGLTAFLGGASYAIDTTAGEKERKTLEMLLTAPAPRIKLILGKFLGVWALSLLAAASTMVGLAIASKIQLKLFTEMAAAEGAPGVQSVFSIGLKEMATIGFGVVLGSMIGSSMMMMLGLYARTYREGTQYLGFLNMAIIVPVIIVPYLSPSTIKKLAPTPLVGIIVAVRDAVLRELTLRTTGLALVSNLLFLAAMIVAMVKMFRSEQVLYRV